MKSLTINQYEKQKQAAIENQAKCVNGTLKDLKLLSHTNCELRGNKLKLTARAMQDLLALLGLKSADATYRNTLEQQWDILIEKLRAVFSTANEIPIAFMVSPAHDALLGIKKGNRIPLSNASFFGLAEQAIDRHQLELISMAQNAEGGVILNTIQPNNPWEVHGFKDESFNGGVSFVNDLKKGMHVKAYLNRLICENGMVATLFQDRLRLREVSARGAAQLLSGINGMSKNNFQPEGFINKVKTACNTTASVYELENAAKKVRELTGCDQLRIEGVLPVIETKNAYRDHGTMLHKLNSRQKRGALTGVSVNDVVNAITYIATHDDLLSMPQDVRAEMQQFGGEILTNEFDHANKVGGPYG